MDSVSILAQARREACELLRRNLTPDGILAATPGEAAEKRRYTRIFGRDAAICALGMMVSGDDALREGARRGLVTLARHQAANGQIPKYVDPTHGEVDFWYLGCVDATLWWLIALRFADAHDDGQSLAMELADHIERALRWLSCQEHPQLCLIQQNEASDWADIMPRSGFVLYSNALWYHVKRLYGLPGADISYYHFNHLFFPYSREIPDYRRLRLLQHYARRHSVASDLYLSFVNFSYVGTEGDVFGNLLAIVFGLAGEEPTHRIIQALKRAEIDRPYPVRTVMKPIRSDSCLWRAYMGRHRQNNAHQYHNGGAWPFIGGFWALALAQQGKAADARGVLRRMVQAAKVNDWEFNEWFHGTSGEPRGMPGQSWNAAMLLLADYALTREGAASALFKSFD